MWTCMNRQCKLQKPIAEFEMAVARYGKTVSSDSRQCNDCILRRQAAEIEQSRRSAEQVQKKARTDAEEIKQTVGSAKPVPKKGNAQKKIAEQVQKKQRRQ